MATIQIQESLELVCTEYLKECLSTLLKHAVDEQMTIEELHECIEDWIEECDMRIGVSLTNKIIKEKINRGRNDRK